MNQYIVPCTMGVEGLVADELKFGGFEGVLAENGRVLFTGGIEACARANINLRCGERVLWRVGDFTAKTFDQLFEGVKALPWSEWIGTDDAFPVKGYSIESGLHSIPDCQKIIKKAVVERLKESSGISWFQETGPKKQIQFSLMKDRCEIYLDTTGASLYKRGYKLEQNEASIRETLAAAMVKVARYRGREPFFDPFCGSGTIAIEAAMAASGIAPGAERSFDAMAWGEEYEAAFRQQREAAQAGVRRESLEIVAVDNDPRAVELTLENARRAGVEQLIRVQQADALTLEYRDKGTLITNPPYGVRMLDRPSADELMRQFGSVMAKYPGLKKYIISDHKDFEVAFGQRADKKRKLYNGMIRCDLYMYFRG